MLIASCCGKHHRRLDKPVFTIDATRAAKFDPTGTLDIRRKFRSDMDKRWQRVRKLVIQSIDRNDALGLGHNDAYAHRMSPVPHVGSDRIKAFQSWIDAIMTNVVLQNGTWMVPYLMDAEKRATDRASRLTARNINIEEPRLDTVVSLAVVELQGVMEAVSQQAIRALAMGHLGKFRPSRVAREVAAVVTTVGRFRGRMLAESYVVKAFSVATLDAFRSLGIQMVGVDPERIVVTKGPNGKTLKRDGLAFLFDMSAKEQRAIEKAEAALQELGEVDVITAGDDAVCEECQDISDNGPYSIDEAESLIPAHPNCRCAFVPTSDDRFANVHEE